MGTRAGRWWLLWLLTMALVVAGCGDGAPARTEGTGDDPSPADEPAAQVPVVDEPSLLDLLAGRGEHGTFTLTIVGGAVGDAQQRHTGRYVAAAGGLTYTVVDLDLALVQREIDWLLSQPARFDDIEPLFADAILRRDTVVTDQLQLGLADALLIAGVFGEAGILAMDPSLSFTAVEEGDPDACREAANALRAAVRRRLLDEAAELGPAWRPAADRLGGEELASILAACDGLADDEVPVELVVDDVSVQLERDAQVLLAVEIEPGAGDALTVTEPRAAPLLDRFGLFFLAIDRCRGLPWLYSNFAAANSYTPPDAAHYIGPTPIGETSVCGDDVPADQRTRGR